MARHSLHIFSLRLCIITNDHSGYASHGGLPHHIPAGGSNEWRMERQRKGSRNCSNFLIQCVVAAKLNRNLLTESKNNTAAHHSATCISNTHINYSNITTINAHIRKRLMAYSVQVLCSLNKTVAMETSTIRQV